MGAARNRRWSWALIVILTALASTPTLGASSAPPAPSVSVDPALFELPGSVTRRAVVTFEDQPTAADVDALAARGLTVSDPFDTLPMLVVDGTVPDLLGLSDLAGARSVYLGDVAQRTLLDETVPYTGATAVWPTDCAGVPCDGRGVAIAVIDTGIDGTHPDLCIDGRVVGELTPGVALPQPPPPLPPVQLAADHFCPGQQPAMAQNVYVTTNGEGGVPIVVEGVANSDATGGHGTHVASIAAGRGNASSRFTGTAPGATLIGVSAGEAVLVLNTLVAFDWVISNADTYGIKVINNSWGPAPGTPYDPEAPVNVASDVATANGMLVVFSAGNSGPTTDTMNAYSAHPSVLSVAAGDNRAPTVDDIAAGNLFPRQPIDAPTGFSSPGVPGDPLLHPDIAAPGQFVIAARASTGFAGATDSFLDPTYMTDPNELARYTTHSGTSMASPHVSGVAALVWQVAAATGQAPSAETVRELLVGTARQFQDGTPGGTTPWQLYRAGYGYVDAAAAVAAVRAGLAGYTDGNDDAPGPDVVYDVASFGGSVVAHSAGACPGTLQPEDPTIPRASFEVFAEALSLDVMLDWGTEAFDLELCTYRPDGSSAPASLRVESDMALKPVDRLHLVCGASACPAGTWTIEIRGTAALQDYTGYASVLYPATATEPAGSVTVTAEPGSATRTTDETHVVTAHATDSLGRDVAGASVQWQLVGAGALTTSDAVTDADGTAAATVASTTEGTSTITVTIAGTSQTATVTWTPAPQPEPLPAAHVHGNGAGATGSGEIRLNLNVARKAVDGPLSGHVRYDGIWGRFESLGVTALAVNGSTATVTAEGTFTGGAGTHTAVVEIHDHGSPGKDNDTFTVTVHAGGTDGPIVDQHSVTLGKGNLQVS